MNLTASLWNQALSKEIGHVCELLCKSYGITLPVCLLSQKGLLYSWTSELFSYNETCKVNPEVKVCPALHEPIGGFRVCSLQTSSQCVVLLRGGLGSAELLVPPQPWPWASNKLHMGTPGFYDILNTHWQLIIAFQFCKAGWNLRVFPSYVSWSLVYFYLRGEERSQHFY